MSRPAGRSLVALHRAGPARLYPAWRLLLAAVFMTAAALASAMVVIFGVPGKGGAEGAPSAAVHMRIVR